MGGSGSKNGTGSRLNFPPIECQQLRRFVVVTLGHGRIFSATLAGPACWEQRRKTNRNRSWLLFRRQRIHWNCWAKRCSWWLRQNAGKSASARARSAALVIDHRAPASLPRGNPFVEAARNGDPTSVLKVAPRRERPASQKRKAAPIKASREAASSVSEPGNQYRGLRPSQVRRKQAGARARAARRGRSEENREEEEVHEVRLDKLEEGTNRNRKSIWIGSIVTILAVAGFLAYQYWPGANNSPPPPTTDTNAAEAAE